MKLTLLSGRSHPALAESVASVLNHELHQRTLEEFPDGELHVEIPGSLLGHDVFILQPTGPPVADNLLELLLLADAARRAGAARVTAVIPYFGYARQDRRTRTGEPVGARVIAGLLDAACNRVVTVDLHTPAIEGFFSIPGEHLSAVPLLADALRSQVTANHVLVAPDLGAVKLAERYAGFLDLPMAYMHKERLSGEKVAVRRLIGEVRGRIPVVVDDMISTGGTLVSAIEFLMQEGCAENGLIAASHGLLIGDAAAKLAGLSLQTVLLTDSLPPGGVSKLPLRTANLAPLLADAIRRLHEPAS